MVSEVLNFIRKFYQLIKAVYMFMFLVPITGTGHLLSAPLLLGLSKFISKSIAHIPLEMGFALGSKRE